MLKNVLNIVDVYIFYSNVSIKYPNRQKQCVCLIKIFEVSSEKTTWLIYN